MRWCQAINQYLLCKKRSLPSRACGRPCQLRSEICFSSPCTSRRAWLPLCFAHSLLAPSSKPLASPLLQPACTPILKGVEHCREFFDQVQRRAESEMLQSSSASSSSPDSTVGRVPPSRQLPSAGRSSIGSNGTTSASSQSQSFVAPPSADLQACPYHLCCQETEQFKSQIC